MGEGNVESHKVGVTSYRLTSLSFHVNRSFHSWDTTSSKFDLENPGQGQMTMMLHNYGSRQFEFHRTSNGINPSSGFRDMGSTKSGPSAAWFDKFLVNGQSPYGANGQITTALHNYMSRQVHKTLNEVNPSSSFRDMRSAKSGPNLWQIWQVFGPWASPYGANGQMTMTVHNYRPRQFHRTSNGENPSSGYRDMGSASLAPPACPNHDNNIPPARRAEGLIRNCFIHWLT